MAPITDQTVADLKAQVQHLERRIHELEQKERGVKPVDASEAMRLILIGPPGAGKFITNHPPAVAYYDHQAKERKPQ